MKSNSQVIFFVLINFSLALARSNESAQQIQNIFEKGQVAVSNLVSSIEKNANAILTHEEHFEKKLAEKKHFNNVVLEHYESTKDKCFASAVKYLKKIIDDIEEPMKQCRKKLTELFQNFKEIIEVVQKYGLSLVKSGQVKLKNCKDQSCVEDLVGETEKDMKKFTTRVYKLVASVGTLTKMTITYYDICTQKVEDQLTSGFKKIVHKFDKC